MRGRDEPGPHSNGWCYSMMLMPPQRRTMLLVFSYMPFFSGMVCRGGRSVLGRRLMLTSSMGSSWESRIHTPPPPQLVPQIYRTRVGRNGHSKSNNNIIVIIAPSHSTFLWLAYMKITSHSLSSNHGPMVSQVHRGCWEAEKSAAACDLTQQGVTVSLLGPAYQIHGPGKHTR